MRLVFALLSVLCALSFAQLEPYEQRSFFKVLADNPSLLATVMVLLVLVITVLYYLFPMKKRGEKYV